MARRPEVFVHELEPEQAEHLVKIARTARDQVRPRVDLPDRPRVLTHLRRFPAPGGEYAMSVTASPALITASCAAATKERPAGCRRNSEVWDKNTRRGRGSLGITHSIPVPPPKADRTFAEGSNVGSSPHVLSRSVADNFAGVNRRLRTPSLLCYVAIRSAASVSWVLPGRAVRTAKNAWRRHGLAGFAEVKCCCHLRTTCTREKGPDQRPGPFCEDAGQPATVAFRRVRRFGVTSASTAASADGLAAGVLPRF